MVDELGLGITVVAEADYTFLDEWQAFACWFSVKRNMPDASFCVELSKGRRRGDKQLYQWARRAGATVVSRHQDRVPTIRVPCHSALIRPYEPEMVEGMRGCVRPLVKEARSEGWYYWVDASECGLFRRSEWLDRADCPLYMADRFATPDLTVSEEKVLRLWGQASSLFVAISRG